MSIYSKTPLWWARDESDKLDKTVKGTTLINFGTKPEGSWDDWWISTILVFLISKTMLLEWQTQYQKFTSQPQFLLTA